MKPKDFNKINSIRFEEGNRVKFRYYGGNGGYKRGVPAGTYPVRGLHVLDENELVLAYPNSNTRFGYICIAVNQPPWNWT